MKVGIIGAGLQGRRRLQALQELGEQAVVISAQHLDHAEALARPAGAEAAAGWEPVVARRDLDAVIVATPPHLHAEICLAASKTGKQILCEKPLTRTSEEGLAVVRAAERDGVVLKCGFNHRYHPAFRQIQAWIGEGRLGRLLFIRAVYGIGGRPGYHEEWRADPSLVSGGQLMEQGIHLVDLSRALLGDIAQVAALTGDLYWQISPLEDNAFVLLRSRSGVPVSIHSSLTQWRNLFVFELFGEDGYARWEGLGGGYGTERAAFGPRDFTAPFKEEVIEYRGGDQSWAAEWREFRRAVDEGKPPSGDARDGLEALRVVEAAYRSAREGRTVDLE